MKRILRLFPLLLALCLLWAGCAQEAETTTPPDQGNVPPQKDETPSEPGEVYGFWFSDVSNGALELNKESDQAKYYSIVRGFYEYYDVATTTYTYDENIATLVLTLEGKEYTFTFDEDEDTLTCEDVVYGRQDAAPAKHPIYPFPDYASIDCSEILTIPTLDVQKIYQYARSDAMREIFKTHYSTGLRECPKITDRAAQLGDIVIIDYIGKHNGVAFSGGTATNQEISISYNNGYIPGFAEGIIGRSIGETFDVPVTFPENYTNSPTLAGEEVVFTMTLHTIYDVRLTQEQLGTYTQLEYETWDAWVDGIARNMLGSLALTILYEEAEFTADLPEETYLYFYQNYVDQIYSYAHYYGMDVEEYLKQSAGISLEDYLEMARENAKSYAYNYVICHEVAKRENLTWSDEDYQTLFASYVKKLTDQGYEEAFSKEYVEEHQKKQIETELICQAVEDWLDESLKAELEA